MNNNVKIVNLTLVALLSTTMMNCSKKSSSSGGTETSGYNAEVASGVIGGVDAGVTGAGNEVGKTAVGGNAIAKATKQLFNIIPKAFASGGGVDSVCDSHGEPLVNSSNNDYPAMVFFCKIAKNTGSPDSVQGSYTLVKSISCMLEKAGLVFDGTTRSVTATPDTTCFTADQISNMGVSTMTISVTASKPAAFNTYFDAGIVMDIPSFGTFKLASKVSGSKLEFIAMEDQSANEANKTGVYAASFDSSTGDLRFEARHDRFSCTTNSSCKWSRHDRIYAKLTMSSGEVSGIESISGIAAEISDNGGSSYYGKISTIKGDISSGVKARYFSASTSTSSNLGSFSNYSETNNTACYTQSSSSASCGSNTGIALGSGSVPFSLHPSTSYSSSATWLAGYSGMSFTSADFSDVQN